MLVVSLAVRAAPLLAATLLSSASPPPADARRVYPAPPLSDTVDDYHGTRVPDPYRTLEDPASPATRAWVEAENRLTGAYLAGIPERDRIRRLVEALAPAESVSTPIQAGGRYFYTRQSGPTGLSRLMVQEGPGGKARALLEPNGGPVPLAGWLPSPDGKRLAYCLAGPGTETCGWKVRDVDTGQDLPDVVPGTKQALPAWWRDGSGLATARPRDPAPGQPPAAHGGQTVVFHRLGAAPSEDATLVGLPDDPDLVYSPAVSHDGRYLVVTVSKGSDRRTGLYVKDLSREDAPLVRLYEPLEARTTFVDSDGATLILRTERAAPRGRLVTVDLVRAGQLGRPVAVELIPQPSDGGVLAGATAVSGYLLLRVTRDASDRLLVATRAGKHVRTAELPTLGTIAAVSGSRSDRAAFYTFTSFLYPPTVYLYDPEGDRAVPFLAPTLPVNPAGFETRQVFCRSKDGARVPLFLVHRKGLAADGQAPAYLFGYGGFGVEMSPAYSPRHVAFVLMGGVFAQACVRGGGEYGRDWHDAGRLARKQNSFDDFAAAAEWMIASKVTSPARLAIAGGSNGGLLVAATLNQHPDLFGAAVPSVGVLDMLRFQKHTVGWAWVTEYGSSDDPEQIGWLLAYSPLHNVKPGTRYPPVLVVTSERDDRVVPSHSYKYVAALQAAQAGDAPILLRVETRGPAPARPVEGPAAEAADVLAFLLRSLGGLRAIGPLS